MKWIRVVFIIGSIILLFLIAYEVFNSLVFGVMLRLMLLFYFQCLKRKNSISRFVFFATNFK